MNDVIYSVPEVAKVIKTNPTYVYSLIKSGLLPAIKLGSLKVRRVALLQFLAKYEGQDLTSPEDVHELEYVKIAKED